MKPEWESLQRWWLFDDPRSYGARSILHWAAEGLARIEKDVSVFPLDPDASDSLQKMRSHLEASQPDVLLLANHPANTFWSRLGYAHAQCPTIAWLFDDPWLMGGEPFGEDEIVWVADPSFEKGARSRGAKTVMFVPVAAPDHLERSPRIKEPFPLVYVGATLRLTMLRDQLPADMAAYLDRIADEKIGQPAMSFDVLLDEIPYQPGKRITLNGQVAYYLYTEANRRYRMRWLEPLASSGLRLFGNEAWREEIRGTALENCFQGPIEPLHEYPGLLSRSLVTLNIRSLQGITAPTHRDFLVPAIGGFMLSTPLQGGALSQGSDDPFSLVTFHWPTQAESPEQMTELVQTALQQETERTQWTNDAADTIRNGHLFSQRLKQVAQIWAGGVGLR